MFTLIVVVLAMPTGSIGASAPAVQDKDIPVTIKELDVASAVREFQDFQRTLSEFREQISQGRALAQETSQILEDLRKSASRENEYNEGPILDAVTNYVDGVIGKQVGLVDFLESQRYRITYYANRMASSLRAEDLALLFGTEEQNVSAITARVRSQEDSRQVLAGFIDTLAEGEFDKATFRPLAGMSQEKRRELDARLYRYQEEKNALALSQKRLQILRAAKRSKTDAGGEASDINADLLVGQMFGTLDRIRLQMSMDLLYLEQMLSSYSQSSRTQEILDAFQHLIELQGDIEGPSPELSSVLDWLQDSSARRISLSAEGLARPGLQVPRSAELLREAYEGARKDDRNK